MQGEDWEHEDVAADDDLDMGESEEDEAGSPVRRWAGRQAGSKAAASGWAAGAVAAGRQLLQPLV